MKYFFTSMIVLLTGFAKGQIVNIPDTAFKNFLLNYQPAIDINHDGEIQNSEAETITELYIHTSSGSSNIHSITGIQSFTNLQKLSCFSLNIDSVDLSNTNRINNLEVNSEALRFIDVSGCITVDTLIISASSSPSGVLTIGRLDSLEIFDLYNFSLDTLDLRSCNNLQKIFLLGNNIKVLNLSGMSNLKNLQVHGQGNDSVEEINLANCTALKQINTSFEYGLRQINVQGCSNLEYLGMGEPSTGVQSLDFSSCPKLIGLNLAGNIKKLNLKNGSVLTFLAFNSIWYHTDTVNICVDEFEVTNVADIITYERGYGPLNISPYCSFFPGGFYNTIKGKSRVDVNINGCDSNDRGVYGVALKITDSTGNFQIRYTAPSGDYGYYPYKGNFTIIPYFPYAYFTINPTTTSVTFDTANSLTSIRDFCIQPNGIHNDLEISFLPTFPPARPGFNTAYTLVYKNRGTTTLSGNVSVNFDNAKMNFISASENVSSQSTGQLTWAYNNLQPFESKTINVTFNLLPPPTNNIGDTIVYLAAITPSANDETAFDNSFVLPQTVIGSFDPNDKQCLEGSKLDISKIGDYLHYQIRFQNEGTDTAFNIVVADTLSDNLDWNSFEFISSSHSCNPQLKNNKAEFIFENIHLPYKAINEPASNGWVAFKIKPKPSVVIGDSLNNSAAIYFDFNLPVITNMATTIVSNSSTPVPVKLEYFSVNKKEKSNQLNWKASCTYGNAAFVIERSNDGINFKTIGNITAAAVRCQLPFNFIDNNPVAGKNYYRLKITDADGKSFYSKVLVVGNNKAGIEITAVANNIVYLNSNKQQTITMKVVASDGREVLNQKQTVGAGNNNISLTMKNSAKGIYILIVYTEEGGAITKRYIK